ncbi:hypothetical protein K438DRAFT_2007897, partial [Mycena galopus ATCC 62051]
MANVRAPPVFCTARRLAVYLLYSKQVKVSHRIFDLYDLIAVCIHHHHVLDTSLSI